MQNFKMTTAKNAEQPNTLTRSLVHYWEPGRDTRDHITEYIRVMFLRLLLC